MRPLLLCVALCVTAPSVAEAQAPHKLLLRLAESADSTPPASSGGGGDLDFDLLGKPEAPPAPQMDPRLKLRRTMLTAHQTMGLALLATTATTLVFGQLNYSDRFTGASTGKWEAPHAIASYTTLGLFGSTGLMAILAPSPLDKPNEGFDRVTLHKIGLFSATAGMAAQAALGIYTVSREGYLDQKKVATAHLVVGYFTFAAMALGVGSIVF